MSLVTTGETVIPPRAAGITKVDYRDLPVRSRYRFLVDDAHIFVEQFITGPVCRGEAVLDVIDQQLRNFWYRDPHESVKDYVYGGRIPVQKDIGIVYHSDQPKRELLGPLRERIGTALESKHNIIEEQDVTLREVVQACSMRTLQNQTETSR